MSGPARRLVTAGVALVGLVLAWCALWGEVSVANVLSGLAVGAVALTVGGLASTGVHLRLGPVLRIIGVVTVDLVVSTISVAREILTPTDYTDELIVDVPVHCREGGPLLFLVIAITVTPGTAVVDSDPRTGTLTLHLLHRDRRDDVVEHVARLDELVADARGLRTEVA